MADDRITAGRPSDAALTRRFLDGDSTAFSTLVDRYQGRVFGFARRMCGHVEDAEDVVQETMLAALRGIESFRGEGSLKSWLFKIASSACLKTRRKGKFDPDREIPIDELKGDDVSGAASQAPTLVWMDDPEGNALKAELLAEVEQALLEMPKANRIVMNLRDFEGFNTAETARILGISEATVKVRLHRARKFVKGRLPNETTNT